MATPWTASWETVHKTVAETAPLGRSATPEDISEAVLSLLRCKVSFAMHPVPLLCVGPYGLVHFLAFALPVPCSMPRGKS